MCYVQYLTLVQSYVPVSYAKSGTACYYSPRATCRIRYGMWLQSEKAPLWLVSCTWCTVLTHHVALEPAHRDTRYIVLDLACWVSAQLHLACGAVSRLGSLVATNHLPQLNILSPPFRLPFKNPSAYYIQGVLYMRKYTIQKSNLCRLPIIFRENI